MSALKRIILLVAVFWATMISGARAEENIDGMWQEVDLVGFRSIGEQCTYVEIAERRLLLKTMPDGTIAGSYSSADSRWWVTRNDGSCELPQAGDGGGFARFRYWNILARPTGAGTWEYAGKFDHCEGDGCDQPGLSRDSFQSGLKLDDGRLVESEVIQGHQLPLRYRRLETAQKTADDAAANLSELMRPLDEGNCVHWYGRSWDPLAVNPSSVPTLCKLMDTIQAAIGTVVSTQPTVVMQLSNRPDRGGTPYPTEDVMLICGVTLKQGATSFRFVVLGNVANRWMIRGHMGL